MSKIFNRDVVLSETARLRKSINGVVSDVIDADGNIDVPITTTNATLTGNTVLGDTSADSITMNGTTTANAPITVGVDGTGYDVKLFGATAGKHLLWDESADTLKLVGGALTDLQGTLTVGVDGTGYDVLFYSATSTKSWLWDESADKMIVTGASDLLGATQQTGTLTVGVDDTGHDVQFFGATASKHMLWDESADTLKLVGGADISVAAGGKITTTVANTVVPVFLNQVPQDISGAGAITLTQYMSRVTNTGSDALTLADSTIVGQVKKVVMVVDPGTDSTLTFNTNATVVFADVGDTAELIWNGSDWIPVALYNCASGDAGPAYTPAS